MEIVNNFITEEEEQELKIFFDSKFSNISNIENLDFTNDEHMPVELLNKILLHFSESKEDLKNSKIKLNNIQVNKYKPHTNVSPHIDDPKYGNTIVILNMLEDIKFNFRKINGELIKSIPITRRSIIKFSDKYRNNYTHSIPNINGDRYAIIFREK